MFTGKFSRTTTVHPGIFLVRAPWADSGSLRGVSNGRLFLRARAAINFLMQAASTLKVANGEQRALGKYSASWNLSLLKRCFAPSNQAVTFKTGQKVQG